MELPVIPTSSAPTGSIQSSLNEKERLLPGADDRSDERLSDQTSTRIEHPALVGATWVNNIWYYALPSDQVKKGKTVSLHLLGDLILIGRKSNGAIFAMRDICPHQGVPLSFGEFDGEQVSCAFHGWKFDHKGVCTDIPSLCDDQKINVCKIKTRSYPCAELDGNIWIYYGEVKADLPEIPRAHGLEGLSYGQTVTRALVPTHMDYAVVALIDPAHVPYVHKSWWWRNSKSLKEKVKKYVPAGTGWTIVKHSPSKGSLIFKLLGDYMETEIAFRMPSCRTEYITFFGRTIAASITTVTPIDETHSELNHTSYWTIPILNWLLKPLVDFGAKEFLGQDLSIAEKQQVGLRFNPKLSMIVKDSGLPGSWYFQAKREWNAASEEGRPFRNPVKEKTLRWKT